MFSEKKPVKTKGEATGMSNRILVNTSIKGEVTSDSDFRIDGSLEGTVKTSGKLVIGKTGVVDGKAECENADIEGTYKGTLIVSGLLSLKSTANVEGEIVASKLDIDAGAVFNATCNMSPNNLKSLTSGQSKKSAS
ncbi:hypothetical protein NBRC110019_19110 [Neptunitalea chrysea]|uniref:Polymer-forming cytoskeletal protein n=1 Tax=Neptunitalea chrysea TaxID=1647581 RepID=A0A9W6B5F9_9FLAO|nr:polymer-forming cytoskeletal protein [Neptunitalea chrysea]GLB52871.1 hypothetical protein NBRC110019_19110 [Neptunitalea chrysea]